MKNTLSRITIEVIEAYVEREKRATFGAMRPQHVSWIIKRFCEEFDISFEAPTTPSPNPSKMVGRVNRRTNPMTEPDIKNIGGYIDIYAAVDKDVRDYIHTFIAKNNDPIRCPDAYAFELLVKFSHEIELTMEDE